MLIEALDHTIDSWIKALDNYTLTQLCGKPSPSSWSLGQVYFHLADNSRFYIEEAKTCVGTDDHGDEQALPEGAAMLATNEFPDTMIDGPDTNVHIPQPNTKQELQNRLLELKAELSVLASLISNSQHRGKTKHPGLGYFSANDWLQFADMHFRHHLRQKKRLDDFLKTNQPSSETNVRP